MKRKLNLISMILWGLLALLGLQPPCGWTDEITTSTQENMNASTALKSEDALMFNFQGVPLSEVLDYLSKAAGFVIVGQAPNDIRVNLLSHQPVDRDEAVLLLDTILCENGYAAIRNGRILKIVSLDKAKQNDIPVQTGADPQAIEKSDQMVTQIIPVRYSDATKLIDNIKPLLPEYAEISSNESSNAVVLTGTQTDVRRIAQIIGALDTSISDISAIQVFMLQRSDATKMAEMISNLFKQEETQSANSRGRNFMPPFMRGGQDQGSNQQDQTNSDARKAASRVVAVADERANAVAVSAPEEIMTTIAQLIGQIDEAGELINEVRVIELKYADAEEMAEIIEEIFNTDEDDENSSQASWGMGRGRRMMPPGVQQQNSSQASQRQIRQSTVTATADTRTNCVVVSAVEGLIDQVERMVAQLDASSAKNKKVFIYDLKNADAETVADILKELFGDDTSGSGGSNNVRNTTNSGSSSTNSSSSNSSSRNN